MAHPAPTTPDACSIEPSQLSKEELSLVKTEKPISSTIVALYPKKRYGLIYLAQQEDANGKPRSVFFPFNVVKNLTTESLSLTNKLKVSYVPNRKSPSSKPAAALVLVERCSKDALKQSSNQPEFTARPTTLSSQEQDLATPSNLILGKIKALYSHKSFGYIAGQNGKDVHFYFNKVRNVTGEPVTLEKGRWVAYILDEKPSGPSAMLVVIKPENPLLILPTNPDQLPLDKPELFLDGVVKCVYPNKRMGFITGDVDKDVHFYLNKVKNSTPCPVELAAGQEVSYQLTDSKERPSAGLVILSKTSAKSSPVEELCLKEMPCKIHVCKKTKKELHSHATCTEQVKYDVPSCGHQILKECSTPEADVKCSSEVMEVVARCGHHVKKLCYEPLESFVCNHPCEETMQCPKRHPCQLRCGDPHNHDYCRVSVEYEFPKCGHLGDSRKECSKPITWKCQKLAEYFYPGCGHKAPKVKKCSDPIRDQCKHRVTYSFPVCGHPSPHRKPCSEPIKYLCKSDVVLPSKCGHRVYKKCYMKDEDAVCRAPCERNNRSCGHKCTNKCGEDCNKGKCLGCDTERKGHKLELQRLRKEEKTNLTTVTCVELSKDDAEYSDVNKMVLKYVQPMHKWSPRVDKIERVKNTALELKFHEAKMKTFGTNTALKFHGTSDEGIKGIIEDGFRLPGPPTPGKRPGMFGQGIYFATDSSKSAQEIYTKRSNKLLLCEVLLGKAMRAEQSRNTLSYDQLRKLGFDSVFAPAGTGVMNDEYVIFDPNQAYPKYIIHYSDSMQPLPRYQPVELP